MMNTPAINNIALLPYQGRVIPVLFNKATATKRPFPRPVAAVTIMKNQFADPHNLPPASAGFLHSFAASTVPTHSPKPTR